MSVQPPPGSASVAPQRTDYVGFPRYTKDQFSQIREQHNIMVFVGNGFDLQVLQEYGTEYRTSYESFFYFLKAQGFDPDNLIFQYMDKERRAAERARKIDAAEDRGWSDIEATIAAVLNDGSAAPDAIDCAVRAIQHEFSRFLELAVPSSLSAQLGDDSMKNGWAFCSLNNFLWDLHNANDYKRVAQRLRDSSAYHLYNFQFINFNYTTLLDDYLFLDQGQFDPDGNHSTVDTNANFKNDPHGYVWSLGKSDPGQSGYLLADVAHPHGVQYIPRSLLFGIDAPDDFAQKRDCRRRIMKPFWAQAHRRFSGYFADCELFIIYGCSIGESDGWWWRQIARHVATDAADLIIYSWHRPGVPPAGGTEEVLNRFLQSASIDPGGAEGATIRRRTAIVLHDGSRKVRQFLDTTRDTGGSTVGAI